ncbi:MAG: membrane protein insertion efficiency factor YidD [Salinivirgaceae bacterium]|nr:membrane protein insertion efficiency factor YidD [Salinivirgaceae bacterium]
MIKYCFLFIAFQATIVYSQNGVNVDKKLLEMHCTNIGSSKESTSKIFKFNPFDWALWVYKNGLSEQISANCEFEPSCSTFSLHALHELGYLKGLFLTADRLTRCNGNAIFEAPKYLITKDHAKIKDYPVYYRTKH